MIALDRLILASASESRACLLRRAGILFEIDPAAVDETAIKARMEASGDNVAAVANALAEAKAMKVSMRHSSCLVIGADQMLDCEGKLFDKPRNMDDARRHLQALRGRDHSLIAAACIAVDGKIVWRTMARARLTMRAFSDRFLDAYLIQAGESVLGSVGAYRIEEHGIQLFSRIDGDHFTILGLPLLDLLEFLRGQKVVAA